MPARRGGVNYSGVVDAFYPPVVATDTSADLAESPVWDATRSRLVFVDILRAQLLVGTLRIEHIDVSTLSQLRGFASFVALGTDGGYVVGAGRDLVRLNASGVRIGQRHFVDPGMQSRFNDGAIDPSGRLLVGTSPLAGASGTQQLLRLEHSGHITVVDADLGLSNGIGWSPDGRLLYSTDSAVGRVYVRDYDPQGESIGGRRTFLDLSGHTPDGMCVDKDGRLWIAMWGDGEVRCYAPDARLLGRVPVPVPLVTSCAFVGPRYDRLLITTARGGDEKSDLSAAPELAGRLFLTDVPAVGSAPRLWRTQFLG